MSEEGAAPGAAPFSLTSYESLVLSHGGSESAISYQLSAISYQLSAISYQLPALEPAPRSRVPIRWTAAIPQGGIRIVRMRRMERIVGREGPSFSQ